MSAHDDYQHDDRAWLFIYLTLAAIAAWLWATYEFVVVMA